MTFLLVGLFTITTVFAQKAPIQFTKTTHSFGKIKQNVPATYVFTFKNVSDKPVVIENAVAECGCTTPEYPKGGIAKGASNKIKVTYNAQTMGVFSKKVTVKLNNVPDPVILTIGGEVITSSTAASTPKTGTKKKA